MTVHCETARFQPGAIEFHGSAKHRSDTFGHAEELAVEGQFTALPASQGAMSASPRLRSNAL